LTHFIFYLWQITLIGGVSYLIYKPIAEKVLAKGHVSISFFISHTRTNHAMHKKARKGQSKMNRKQLTNPLTLLPLSLSDLCRETALDGLNGPSATAAVARDETETVLSLAEFGVGGLARFADDIVNNVASQHAGVAG
jgi:hypothetical protein